MSRESGWSRRQFLERVGLGALGSAALRSAAVRAQSRPLPPPQAVQIGQIGGRRLVNPSDFTFLGSFRLPDAVDSGGMGLEFYADGNGGAGSLFVGLQRFTDYPNTFCEVSIPEPALSPSRLYAELPTASLVRPAFDQTGGIVSAWVASDPVNHKVVTTAISVVNVPGRGKKLFWGCHGWYTAQPPFGVGYCDLDPNPTHPVVSNPRGPWGFTGVSSSQYANTIWNVPQSWADLYMGGRSVGIGGHAFGHVVSETAGGHSAYYFAPWIDDPTNAAPAANAAISFRKAQGYAGTEAPRPDGMRYPGKLVEWGWKPPADSDHPGGYNYFWNSESHVGMRWVTTSDGRSALVGASSIGCKWSCYIDGWYAVQQDDPRYVSWPWPRQGPKGTICYFPTTGSATAPVKGPVAGFWRPALLFFDPADHAAVVAGQKQAKDVVAYDARSLWEDLAGSGGKYDWYTTSDGTRVCYDGQVRDTRQYGNNYWGQWSLTGAAFDQAKRRYYVLQYGAAGNPYGPILPVVHVFQVA